MSRNEILKSIRAQRVPTAELPSLDRTWLRYSDPLAQFESQLAGVGGRAVRVRSTDEITPILNARPEFANAQRIVSYVPGVAANCDLGSIEDPHELESVDWAIMPAEFGVAENGAVWVTDERIRHRAIYFIVQHLALVLPMDQIVHNMHEAYGRLSVGSSSLGVFISGPSKTADIEQSLVIGAHGPRSMTVFLVGPA
jgi:L-lactate dehydrogenase complex protein LldG